MSTASVPDSAVSLCPKCHLPVHDHSFFVLHEGKRYHELCAPVPEVSGEKDNPYR